MRKPNYRFERAERDRAKKAKTDKKLQQASQHREPNLRKLSTTAK